MAFLTKIDAKLIRLFGRRWPVYAVRFAKLCFIFGSILWACYGALDAVLRDDRMNCFFALFGASGPAYLLSLHLVSKYKLDWKTWPLRVVHIHIYANAFLGMLTAFAFTCCVVIYFLLDTRRFDANSYAEDAAWLLYALVWQVIIGTTLKALVDRRYRHMEMTRRCKWQRYTRYVELKARKFDGESERMEETMFI